MSDMAKLIDAAFAAGCTGITIWKSETYGYQANVRGKDNKSWRVEVGREPAGALLKALGVRPTTPRRSTEDLI